MGQHKNNITAQLAKEGKLPPKPAKMGKKELDRWIEKKVYDILCKGIGTNGDTIL